MFKTKANLIFFGLFMISVLFILNGQEEKPLRIAVASDGETADSRVGSQGARSAWLLLFDEKGEMTEALKNPFCQGRGGIGIKLTRILADKKVTVFVAGNLGRNMEAALDEHEITFMPFSGTVKDAIVHILQK